MNANTINIIKLIKGDVYQLSGQANKKLRRAILSDILGCKVAASQAGVNNILAELVKLSGVTAFSCYRDLEMKLEQWAQNL